MRVLPGLLLAMGLLAADGTVDPPEHDLPENAIRITEVPFSHSFDARGATGTSDEPQPCDLRGSGDHTVWYRFHADRDMKLEFAIGQGVGRIEAVDPDTCHVAGHGGDEAWLEAGGDYLIRASASDQTDSVTFATREYHELAPPTVEFFPIARVTPTGDLELTTTIVCDRPGDVELMLYAAQLKSERQWYLTSTDPFEPTVACDGETPYTMVLPPAGGEPRFRPGPVEVWWDATQCERDPFRYAAWERCAWTTGGRADVIAAPTAP